MPAKKISQRDARRTRKQLDVLERQVERQRSAWSAEYINGVEFARIDLSSFSGVSSAIRTARLLGHAVVVVQSDNIIGFVALPHPKEPV